MSAEKISELDKRVAIQEASLNRVLEAVERQANSTEKLTESVTKLTTNLSVNITETKELRQEVKELSKAMQVMETEIAVIKRGNKWIEWLERGITMAIVAGVVWAVKSAG